MPVIHFIIDLPLVLLTLIAGPYRVVMSSSAPSEASKRG